MSKRERKRGIAKTAAAMLLLFAAAGFIIYLILGGGESIKRIWRQMSGDESGELYYDGASGNAYALPGGSLAVLSQSRLTVLDEDGNEQLNILVSFTSPMLSSKGDYSAAWDLGGSEVILVDEQGLVTRLTSENSIISVTVNENGYLCVATDETGYGGSVTVYSPWGEALYKWYSGSNYILSARLRDESELCVLTLGKSGSAIVSMRITETQERARYETEDIILDFDFTGNGILAVSSSKLISLNKSLEERDVFELEGRHLEGYSLQEDFALIVAADYQSGGEKSIITLNSSCDELGSMAVSGEVLSISTSRNRAAVMTPGRVEVYDIRLQYQYGCPIQSGGEKVLVKNNGSVIVAGAYSAQVYTQDDEVKSEESPD